MKLLIALFVPLLCLQLTTSVSSQALLTAALSQLIEIDRYAHANATSDVLRLYGNVSIEINNELQKNVLPTLNQTNYNIMEYNRSLYNQLTPLGYNLTRCFQLVDNSFRNVSNSSSVTNVTAKAIEEKEVVYDRILYMVYSIGMSNIDRIHDEVESIYDEYFTCVTSSYPQYCNRTLYTKVIAKQEEIPNIYKKNVEIAKTNLIQQTLIYKNRVQDYVNEIIKTTKPYLSLLEICVQQVLSFGR